MAQNLVSTEQVGDFFLRNFDEGLVNTLGAEIIGDQLYLPLDKAPGVDPPLFTEFANDPSTVNEPMPGIPIIFKNPGDETERYVVPCIRIGREDPSPALERWMGLHMKYRRPAPGASPVTLTIGNRTLEGYDRYEAQFSSWPYDIPYTITCEANGERARTNAQVLLRHCMGIFGPHGILTAYDSLGHRHKFEVFGEGPSDLSSASDIRDRTIIYALSLRVAGKLDLSNAYTSRAVTVFPTRNFDLKGNE